MEDNHKILKVFLKFPIEAQGTKSKFKVNEMQTTSNRRRAQNDKNGISQQPMIRSSSNVKLRLRGTNKN